MEKISYGKYVELAYEIFVVGEGDEQTSVFEFTAERPDRFVFGNDLSLIVGFVKNIDGLPQDAKFDFTLSPEEAFGDRDENLVFQVPCDTFERNGEFDNEHVYVGAMVPMRFNDTGQVMEGQVKAIDEENVTLDFNHPLSGERVRYVGMVLTVRDATPEELAPRHGCGCGCDHDGCGHDHDGCNCDQCGGC
ncbi:MAG: peptidylprolyl isomerase [Muribaculaceae bacterium]|nr:peptidylprolyl isomerase [Muribaculaceae bacterium]